MGEEQKEGGKEGLNKIQGQGMQTLNLKKKEGKRGGSQEETRVK